MKHKKRNGKLLMSFGVLLILISLAMTAYNYTLEEKAEKISSQIIQELNITVSDESNSEIPYYEINSDIQMPVISVNGESFVGTLEIPVLNLELPVIETLTYSALKKAPCVFEGTPYKNNLIIGAHNYKSHFAYLKNLSAGDKVIFTDTDGNVFTYSVLYIEILDKNALESLRDGEWDLTLFTCTYGGSQRVTVRCKKV